MTTGHGHADHAGDLPLFLDGPALADELARRKDVQPISSADDLACDGIFEPTRNCTSSSSTPTPHDART